MRATFLRHTLPRTLGLRTQSVCEKLQLESRGYCRQSRQRLRDLRAGANSKRMRDAGQPRAFNANCVTDNRPPESGEQDKHMTESTVYAGRLTSSHIVVRPPDCASGKHEPETQPGGSPTWINPVAMYTSVYRRPSPSISALALFSATSGSSSELCQPG